MTDMPFKLSRTEQHVVDRKHSEYAHALKSLEYCKQFKIGDILVLKILKKPPTQDVTVLWDDEDDKDLHLIVSEETVKNSYNVDRKFKVVYADQYGFTYCKALNKRGKIFGDLIYCGEPYRYGWNSNQIALFQVDPRHVDATIFGENYDPAQEVKEKAALWKEINAHNAAIRIKMPPLDKAGDKEFSKFFHEEFNIGFSYWTNYKNQYVVQEKFTLKHDVVAIVVSNKGKTRRLRHWELRSGVIYREAPRSLKELKS